MTMPARPEADLTDGNASVPLEKEAASCISDHEVVNDCWRTCVAAMPLLTVDEHYDLYLCLRHASDDLNLGLAFACLEELKNKGWIQNYCISQITLEQVFVKLVKSKENDVET